MDMAETSLSPIESDYSRMNLGMVTIYCKTCKKITEQNYLGLEFYSRKIASRCLSCKDTNFQEEDMQRWRNRVKKDKTPLKEIEEEKAKIFGSDRSTETNAEDDLLDEIETRFDVSM